jgi:hypothetical protein
MIGSTLGCATGTRLPVYGSWRIASLAQPDAAAQPSVPALSLIGVSASFSKSDARIGTTRCSRPNYVSKTMTAAELSQEYHVTAAAVGVSAEPITVYQIECPAGFGAAPSVLIVKSEGALLSPQGAMVYELVRK